MSNVTSILDILKHLPKTNCRQCGVKTCMAFADAVIKGLRRIEECPHVSAETIALVGGNIQERASIEREQEKAVAYLKGEVARADLNAAAERLDTSVVGGRLLIRSLGKEFYIGADGELSSQCHTVMPWLAIPMLSYVLTGGTKKPTGKWVAFEELSGGRKWARLFGQRCEKDFKELADGHPGLFGDVTAIFSGTAGGGDIKADVSLVLSPLPGLPLLICYWMKEDDFESKLKLYFDATAEDNLNIEYIYTLCVGLVMMFGKIALRHK